MVFNVRRMTSECCSVRFAICTITVELFVFNLPYLFTGGNNTAQKIRIKYVRVASMHSCAVR